MRLLRKILLWIFLVLLVLVGAIVLVVGPWPTYADSNFEQSNYYRVALAAIDAHASAASLTDSPGRLQAGWAAAEFTPPVGTPMGGYSGRGNGKKSEGVRDPLFVRTLALSDGVDTIVFIGADMLITPPNIAEMVRQRVAAQAPLTGDDLLFNASHTHCGPGAFAPGLIPFISAGEYDPQVPELIAAAFTKAVLAAYNGMEPAKLGSGSVDAPQFIRNRVRKGAPVDAELSFLAVEQDDGDRCYMVSYSAHPTIFGEDMMHFSAEYPGALMHTLHEQTHADGVYLGGAVGSMGPSAPDAPTDSERVDAMGAALAALVIENSANLTYESHFDVAAVGVPIGMPPLQLRPIDTNTGLRISPLLPKILDVSRLGLPTEGWLHGARVGRLMFVGMPCDFSGEISLDWKAWAADQGFDLWTLSFCSTYCGYFSPDKYYLDTPLSYETGIMSWFGPNIEAYMTALFKHAAKAIAPQGNGA